MRFGPDFLREVLWKVGELEGKHGDKREGEKNEWGWGKGLRVVVNPEVRCPGCNGWVETDRIWLLGRDHDTGEDRIYRLWKWGTGERMDVGSCHPHVDGGGVVCLGENDEAEGALFTGLSPESGYGDQRDNWGWLEALGHRCDAVERGMQGEWFCPLCESEGDEDDASYSEHHEQSICQSCFDDTHQSCGVCHERKYVGSDGDLTSGRNQHGHSVDVCDGCLDSHYFQCTGCDENFHLDLSTEDNGGNLYCRSCYDREFDRCKECDGEVESGELNPEGHCSACVERLEEEEREGEAEEEEEDGEEDLQDRV